MNNEEMIKRLSERILPVLTEEGLVLFDLFYRQSGRTARIEILVDKPCGGITIEECARLNRRIDRMIQEDHSLDRDHTLEISSPGVDRPLKIQKDFQRVIQQKVRVLLKEPVSGKYEYVGTLQDVTDTRITVTACEESIFVELSNILKAEQFL